MLRNMICDDVESKAIVEGVVRNWEVNLQSMAFWAPLARGLLGRDGRECARAIYFDKATTAKLSAAAAKLIPEASPTK